ncbi:hypothetical protein OMW55_08445 [Sphingomonas sp. BN140010]|uniref:DUF2059 domain-containing protein n=1 Tax=Sphingomonas arvum TaxID=2992113 RepID=A0ABT3JGC2_9SPHN|nr:hypothetical protein [Sphingomonas sp. BN140010]MCW3797831.1 hypothetical protein [Sphingomonas sp. BN140010]
MSFNLMLALAAAAVGKPTTTDAMKPPVITTAPATGRRAVDPMEAMAGMMKIIDKVFPAGPEPEPARLAIARDATFRMFPKGAYAQAMNGFIDKTVDHVLSMSEADLADLAPTSAKKNGKAGKPPSTEPLRLALTRKDPNFDAKLAAGKAFAQVMLTKVADAAEPRFRDGMARSLARKFDTRQLGEIQAFLATPTGAAYGRQMIGLWFEPDVIRGTFEAFPEIMRLMPELAKDGATFQAQMESGPKKK